MYYTINGVQKAQADRMKARITELKAAYRAEAKRLGAILEDAHYDSSVSILKGKGELRWA